MKLRFLFAFVLTIASGCGSGIDRIAGAGGSAATGGELGGAAGSGAAGATGSVACNQLELYPWIASGYSCAGGTFLDVSNQEVFTLSWGPVAMFWQNNEADGGVTCSLGGSGSFTCSGNQLTFVPGTVMCVPATCNSECGSTGAPIQFTFSLSGSDSSSLTTVTPDTTPLTVCTDQGMSNPVTIYWVIDA